MRTPKKLAVVGFDSAMTHWIDQFISEGCMPNFKKVFENGVVADQALCPYPTVTPPNWGTIATGASAGTHQVTDFWICRPNANPTNENSLSAFNANLLQAETMWEAAAKGGKKAIVLNYPGGWPAHEKNPDLADNLTVVGGCGLTVGTITDGLLAEEKGLPLGYITGAETLCYPHLISNETYPLGIRGEIVDAEDWSNVDEMGDEPLEMAFHLTFPLGITKPGRNTWHLLIREMNDAGYDTVTLSPSKDFSQAFCTLKAGEWSKRIVTQVKQSDGREREVSFMCRSLKLSDDAEEFVFYMSEMLPTDGELWCHPPNLAKELLKVEATPTIMGGFQQRTMDWYDDEMFRQLVESHNVWLSNCARTLLENQEWDVFYMHTHPTDFIYHYLITQLDPEMADSPERHAECVDFHREVYKGADYTLGEIMKALDDDTLLVVCADHGSVPDGYHFDPWDALTEAGLATLTEADGSNLPDDFKYLPENLKQTEGVSWMSKPILNKTKAIPQRLIFIYVNLKSKYPDGCVEDEDYELVQREIIEALQSYKDPATGRHPVALALSKEDARLLGLKGGQCGDVVYAVHPEFSGQHGNILPTAKWRVGTLQPLLGFYGPGVKKGYRMERTCNLIDIVPTACYMTGLPVPADTEGAVIYQIMEDPNMRG